MAWGIIMTAMTMFGMLALVVAWARTDDGPEAYRETDSGPEPRATVVHSHSVEQLKKAA
jgi:hypothetical protein